MFTGLITAIGRITSIQPLTPHNQADIRITLDAGAHFMSDVGIGDSIAINGACMTVVEKTESGFSIDLSNESLSRTTGFTQLRTVNLEKALTLSDRLGGHLVSGHVDGIGMVQTIEPIATSTKLTIHAPQSLAKYLAYKGSIVIDGVSLTINEIKDYPEYCAFSVNIIPHTQEVTTLGQLQAGASVNLEIDLIARYCERMLSFKEM